jgi:hypothetical protein
MYKGYSQRTMIFTSTKIVAVYRRGNIHKEWADVLHNLQEWALENPHATWSSSFQQKFSVIWARSMDDYLIGPCSMLISVKKHSAFYQRM